MSKRVTKSLMVVVWLMSFLALFGFYVVTVMQDLQSEGLWHAGLN
jgi:hypothetical protein